MVFVLTPAATLRLQVCNAIATRPAYPCIGLDTLMPTTCTLVIGAKINNFVDERPYEGSMLHAVPMVTCFVQGKQPPPLYGGTPNSPEAILAAEAAEAAAHHIAIVCVCVCVHVCVQSLCRMVNIKNRRIWRLPASHEDALPRM